MGSTRCNQLLLELFDFGDTRKDFVNKFLLLVRSVTAWMMLFDIVQCKDKRKM